MRCLKNLPIKAFLLVLLGLPLGACTASSDPTNAVPATSLRASLNANDLSRYHWQLSDAVDANDRHIDALFSQSEQPLQLDFSDQRISVGHACNAISGRYRIVDGHLETKLLLHTMMACTDPVLQQRETIIEVMLRGGPSLILSNAQARPRLNLVAASGQTLIFSGKATAQTRYQGPGDTVFLEVAAHTVPCSAPGDTHAACLRVRQRHYDTKGRSRGAPGPWHPLAASIDGFTRQDGVHYVLRVTRHALSPAASGEQAFAYVLDGIVESVPPQPSD
jgi:hypothetical protein